MEGALSRSSFFINSCGRVCASAGLLSGISRFFGVARVGSVVSSSAPLDDDLRRFFAEGGGSPFAKARDMI